MISLRMAQREFVIGGQVAGTVVWTPENDCTPRKITVGVGWRTEGRGDVDRELVLSADEEGQFATAGQSVSIPFRGQIPADAVPSFTGHLLRVLWFVSIRVDLPWAFDETTEVEIAVLSQTAATRAARSDP